MGREVGTREGGGEGREGQGGKGEGEWDGCCDRKSCAELDDEIFGILGLPDLMSAFKLYIARRGGYLVVCVWVHAAHSRGGGPCDPLLVTAAAVQHSNRTWPPCDRTPLT